MKRLLPRILLAAVVVVAGFSVRAQAAGGGSTIVFRFTPAPRAQLALWLESADGRYLATVRLTQAVSYYGIGNRPGASQMNSGFRWPYGRREGVLPVWSHRRAAAPGAQSFRRVIFQNRMSEGDASRTSDDFSPDVYFCLSFNKDTTSQTALDATSCASQFSSDKGRYLRPAEIYKEPVETAGKGDRRTLSYDSLYPPRRDVTRCTATNCNDTADVASFAADARAVMPDIDALTMATAAGGTEQEVLFTLPSDWTDSDFVAWMEVSVEGDHNAVFSEDAHPTPKTPSGDWDSWAMTYGYPYLGQPSVVFRVPFSASQVGRLSAAAPIGYGSLLGYGDSPGAVRPLDDSITDDPILSPGSGADRLQKMTDGGRFAVEVRACPEGTSPGPVSDLTLKPVANSKHSHEWGTLSFVPSPVGEAVTHYEVRYSREAITDDASFMRALPAVQADLDSKALVLPSTPDGQGHISADFGGMIPLTTYYLAVQSVDGCNRRGPIVSSSVTTTKINFTQLPPVRPWKGQCFVATAAFGSPMAPSVSAIRDVRDQARQRSGLFAAVDELYHQAVPPAADALARSEVARAVFRELLSPVAQASSLAHPPSSPDGLATAKKNPSH